MTEAINSQSHMASTHELNKLNTKEILIEDE